MTASQSPTLVSDTFHFSSYYWRESYYNLESLQADSNDGSEFSAGSSDGQVFALKDRVRSTSVTSDGEEYLSPRPVPKNNNRIKLKFYDHVMGDGKLDVCNLIVVNRCRIGGHHLLLPHFTYAASFILTVCACTLL